MPLAPLGCGVQVHESPKSRLSWAFWMHDGWYLRTSPEHYHCHVVFVKKTIAERILDTVIFQHWRITNPEITPINKLIVALTNFRTAANGIPNTGLQLQINKLTKLISRQQNTDINDSNNSTPTVKHLKVRFALMPRPEKQLKLPSGLLHQPTPPSTNSSDQAICCNIQQSPRVVTATVDKHTGSPICSNKMDKVPPPKDQVAHQHTVQKAIAIQNLQQTLQQTQTPAQYVAECINEVFNIKSRKLLKYRQLLKHQKYHNTWSRSAANEFGRLPQDVRNRISGTDTICFVCKADIPRECWKDITYAKFVCKEKPNKKEIH